MKKEVIMILRGLRAENTDVHAALRAAVEMLFPFDSNETEEEPGGLKSFHKGRRW